jgi:hypothetical protein
VSNVSLKFRLEDERPAVVLDDASSVEFHGFSATTKSGVPTVVTVTNTKKRAPDFEYLKDTAYNTTKVSDLQIVPNRPTVAVTVDRPAPGTPPDSLYAYPTAPSAAHPYAYAVADENYPKPLTVYPPVFEYIGAKSVQAGQPLQFTVAALTPAGAELSYAADLPVGATFDKSTQTFSWTPTSGQIGAHRVKFTVDDGVLAESTTVEITVLRARAN